MWVQLLRHPHFPAQNGLLPCQVMGAVTYIRLLVAIYQFCIPGLGSGVATDLAGPPIHIPVPSVSDPCHPIPFHVSVDRAGPTTRCVPLRRPSAST